MGLRAKAGADLGGDSESLLRICSSPSCSLVTSPVILCLAGRELVDGARYLLLSGGGPVDALPHGVEVESDSFEPLLIGRGSLGCRAGRIRRAIRNWRGPGRAADLKMRSRDDSSGRVTVGQPSQHGNHTNPRS